ncbi:HlyD family type I secretion periplasmic adaptor subunit [Roseibium suaedae]|uniref:Membrane fusion protein (MFP) family protein n=1 Tax=Roseibium suaedae TaxID=735517 RepID=A0A1M6YXN6_9HYPH|nr:HlyD family type I secretion periplasmic adaptor subunit [Roseibium suaedae]SHL22809.1 membrane fusion protein PrsE [Roseibium suaedae]
MSASHVPEEGDTTLRASLRRHFLISFVLCVALFGGGIVWASTQNISGAVVASGKVAVESNIKQVQHREGGIVKEIYVQDGDVVEAGNLVLKLDDTVTKANLAVVNKQISELTAQEARLAAERDGLAEISFSNSVRGGSSVAELTGVQRLLFDARRASLAGRKQQFEEQILQFEKQIEGLTAQLSAKAQEIDLVAVELNDLGGLLDKQLVSKSRVTALKRESARLQGEYGSFVSQIAQAKEAISERRILSLQLDEGFRAEVLEQLQEVRSRLAQLEEQKIAAADMLTRMDIRAPQTGYVHQLSVHTVHGVIAPGETVMLIVPQADQLIVEAKVRPIDIDQLGSRQVARIRFPGFDHRTTPELEGQVLTVSADTAEDQRTGVNFYSVRVLIDASELEKLKGKVLVPGMPAEVFLTTQERSVLSYLAKPLMDQVVHAMRER